MAVESNNKQPDSRDSLKWVLVFALVSLLLIFVPFNLIDGTSFLGFKIRIEKYADLAQFVSGITAPVLSFCAIYLVYKTYKAQKEELETTNKTMDLQRFENTFFQMLNLQQQIISKIEYTLSTDGKERSYSGREMFFHTKKHLVNHLKSRLEGSPDITKRVTEFFSTPEYYNSFYKEYESIFNHYFRHLYYIYKHVYFSTLSDNEKKKYADIIGAQISQDEFFLIAFNATLEGYGYPKFTYLLKEYNVLRNFRDDEIEFPEVNNFIFELIKNVKNPFFHNYE